MLAATFFANSPPSLESAAKRPEVPPRLFFDKPELMALRIRRPLRLAGSGLPQPCPWHEKGSPPATGPLLAPLLAISKLESCGHPYLKNPGFLRAFKEFLLSGVSPMLCIGRLARFQPSATAVRNRHKRRSATYPEPGALDPAKTLFQCLTRHRPALAGLSFTGCPKSCSHKGSVGQGM